MAKPTTNRSSVEVVEETPKRQLTMDTLVHVMNNTTGKLIYNSQKSGITWIFEKYGDTDFMELGELVRMKSGSSKFFTNSWLLVLDRDVIDYLRLNQYYKGLLTPEEVELFFDLDIEEIDQKLGEMSASMKAIIIGKAIEKIQNGEFDSNKKIKLIEAKLGVDLNVE